MKIAKHVSVYFFCAVVLILFLYEMLKMILTRIIWGFVAATAFKKKFMLECTVNIFVLLVTSQFFSVNFKKIVKEV